MREQPLKLTAFQIHEDDFAPIRPARRERKWMDDADKKFPYRCLPLVVANQHGWEILSTHHIRAVWDGTSNPDGVSVENLSGDGALHASSHFGAGVLTFRIPFLFQTPEGWNLMVRGPANNPKDGIVALDGVVETDWTFLHFYDELALHSSVHGGVHLGGADLFVLSDPTRNPGKVSSRAADVGIRSGAREEKSRVVGKPAPFQPRTAQPRALDRL